MKPLIDSLPWSRARSAYVATGPLVSRFVAVVLAGAFARGAPAAMLVFAIAPRAGAIALVDYMDNARINAAFGTSMPAFAELSGATTFVWSGDSAPAGLKNRVGTAIALDMTFNRILWNYWQSSWIPFRMRYIFATIGQYGSLGGVTPILELHHPVSVVGSASGSVFVSDKGNSRLVRLHLAADGTLVADTAIGSGPGSNTGVLRTPEQVALDPTEQKVYVADSGNHGVRVYSASSGVYLFGFGGFGSEVADLQWPTGIAVDSGGSVFVCDNSSRKIQKFDAVGDQVATASGMPSTSVYTRLALDDEGRVWALDYANQEVHRFDGNLSYVGGFDGTGVAHGGRFGDASTLAVHGKVNSISVDKDRRWLVVVQERQIQAFTIGGVGIAVNASPFWFGPQSSAPDRVVPSTLEVEVFDSAGGAPDSVSLEVLGRVSGAPTPAPALRTILAGQVVTPSPNVRRELWNGVADNSSNPFEYDLAVGFLGSVTRLEETAFAYGDIQMFRDADPPTLAGPLSVTGTNWTSGKRGVFLDSTTSIGLTYVGVDYGTNQFAPAGGVLPVATETLTPTPAAAGLRGIEYSIRLEASPRTTPTLFPSLDVGTPTPTRVLSWSATGARILGSLMQDRGVPAAGEGDLIGFEYRSLDNVGNGTMRSYYGFGRSEWPQFRHDHRRSGASGDRFLSPPLGLKWSFQAGDRVNSSAAVNGDHLFVGDDTGFLYARDSRDGSSLWLIEHGGEIRNSPATDDEFVYYVAQLPVASPETPNPRATNTFTNSPSPTATPDGGYTFTPTSPLMRVSPAASFSATPGTWTIYGRDRASGTLQWSYPLYGPGYSSVLHRPGRDSNDYIIVADDSATGNIFAFDRGTGFRYWKDNLGGPARSSASISDRLMSVAGGANDNDPFVYGHTILVYSGVGGNNPGISARHLGDGSLSWFFKTTPDAVVSSPVFGYISAGSTPTPVVFFATEGGSVYCLPASQATPLVSPTPIWSLNIGAGYAIRSSLAYVDGAIYGVTRGGTGVADPGPVVFKLSGLTGVPAWTVPFPNGLQSNGSVSYSRSGYLWISTRSNSNGKQTLWAVPTSGGAPIAVREFGLPAAGTSEPFDSSASIAHGELYIGSNDGSFYALAPRLELSKEVLGSSYANTCGNILPLGMPGNSGSPEVELPQPGTGGAHFSYVGGKISYRIKASNAHPWAATEVEISDLLGPDLIYVGSNPTPYATVVNPGGVQGTLLKWHFPRLDPTLTAIPIQTVQVVVTAEVNASATPGSQIQNAAIIESDQYVRGTATALPVMIIGPNKAVNRTCAWPAAPIVYTLSYAHRGPTQSVEIKDQLSAYLVWPPNIVPWPDTTSGTTATWNRTMADCDVFVASISGTIDLNTPVGTVIENFFRVNFVGSATSLKSNTVSTNIQASSLDCPGIEGTDLPRTGYGNARIELRNEAVGGRGRIQAEPRTTHGTGPTTSPPATMTTTPLHSRTTSMSEGFEAGAALEARLGPNPARRELKFGVFPTYPEAA